MSSTTFDPQKILDSLREKREQMINDNRNFPVDTKENSYLTNCNTNVQESITNNNNNMIMMLMKEIGDLKTHIKNIEDNPTTCKIPDQYSTNKPLNKIENSTNRPQSQRSKSKKPSELKQEKQNRNSIVQTPQKKNNCQNNRSKSPIQKTPITKTQDKEPVTYGPKTWRKYINKKSSGIKEKDNDITNSKEIRLDRLELQLDHKKELLVPQVFIDF